MNTYYFLSSALNSFFVISTILSKRGFISSSVKVLSFELNVSEYAKLFLPSSIPFPSYTSKTSISFKLFPQAFLIVFASSNASIFLSTTSEISFLTFGNFDISLYLGFPVFISCNLLIFNSHTNTSSFVISGCNFPIIPTFFPIYYYICCLSWVHFIYHYFWSDKTISIFISLTI